MADLESIKEQALEAVGTAEDLAALDAVRVRYLGKKGEVTSLLKTLGSLPPEERREQGQAINRLKAAVQEALEAKRAELEATELEDRLAEESVDVTLPGRGQAPGGLHPVTRLLDRIEQLFVGMGFEVATGPEIEDEFHNFDALNFPPNHPSWTPVI